MRLAIKNPAPIGERLTRWGDYQFGRALRQALAAERPTATVTQHFWPEWDRGGDEDAVFVLRGKRQYVPPSGKLSLMWNISHPATVSPEEIDLYSGVFVSSRTHLEMLRGHASTPVSMLRQCTDGERFHGFDETSEQPGRGRNGVYFVANSRGLRRQIVDWALEAGVSPSIIGSDWERIGLSHLVVQEHLESSELPALYRRAWLSLNDHWSDMRHFGVINNRVFDCLACGLPVLSDHFPELEEVAGDAVLYARDARGVAEAVRACGGAYPAVLERTRRCWERIGEEHTFRTRAKQIWECIDGLARAGAYWSIQEPRQHAISPEAEVLAGHLASMLERHGAMTGQRQWRVLHCCPTQPGLRKLASVSSCIHVSAGLGVGPWQIALDTSFRQIRDLDFDVVVIERFSDLDELAGARRQELIASLLRATRGTALIGFPPREADEDWQECFERSGFRCVARHVDWVVFAGASGARDGLVADGANVGRVRSFYRRRIVRSRSLWASSVRSLVRGVRHIGRRVFHTSSARNLR